MDTEQITAGIRKHEYQGLDCWQPKLTINTPVGKITHYARGVYLTRRKDAKSTAEQWKRECLEVGYVTR